MTHEEKVAIARVMSDIIKADGKLAVEQFVLAHEIEEQYHISAEDQSQARQITFSTAVKNLKELSRLEKKELLRQIQSLAFADHIVVTEEARLLTALKYSLEQDVQMLSVPSTATSNQLGIIYMEDEYDEDYNEELQDTNTYRLIDGLCRLNGIEFTYIPAELAEFTKLDKNEVTNILRYMSPSLTEEESVNVARRMGEITTSEFYLKLMNPIMSKANIHHHAFLAVSIGVSMTPYCKADGNVTFNRDYLYLPIKDTVLATIEEFVDIFKSFLTVQPMLSARENTYNFQFYKLFFDFLLTPPPVEPDLILCGEDPRTGKFSIAFRFGTNYKYIGLTPKEYEAFETIVEKTFQSRTHGMAIGMERTTIAPVISHIRQKITTELPEIGLIDRYKPERSGNKYTIDLQRDKVYVRKYSSFTQWEDVPF